MADRTTSGDRQHQKRQDWDFAIATRRATFLTIWCVLLRLITGKTVLLMMLMASTPAQLGVRLLSLISGKSFDVIQLGQSSWLYDPEVLTTAEGRSLRRVADELLMEMIGFAVEKEASRPETDAIFNRKEGGEEVCRLFFEIELFVDVQEHLYSGMALLAEMSRNSRLSQETKLILAVPNYWWSRYLSIALADLNMRVEGIPRPDFFRFYNACLRPFTMRWRLSGSPLAGIVRNLKEKLSTVETQLDDKSNLKPAPPLSFFVPPSDITGLNVEAECLRSGPKVGTILYDRIEPSKRSNIKWFWEEGVPRESVCIIVSAGTYTGMSGDTYDRVTQAGTVMHFDQVPDSNENKIPMWRPSAERLARDMKHQGMQLLPSMLKASISPTGAMRWFVEKRLEIVYFTAWWREYFQANDIKIFVEDYYDRDAIARYMAMRSLGGLVVTTERSQEYDHGVITIERYGDVHIMAGPHSLRQPVRPELRKRVLVAGFPLDETPLRNLADVDTIRRTLSPDLPLVFMADEGGLLYGREHVFAFYEAVLKDLDLSSEYRLLIKSKKPLILHEVYSRFGKRIFRLQEEGKLIFLDYDCPVSVAAALGDICITVPSTAMFDPMVLGKPTAVFNPARILRNVFYDQGLGDVVVFEDLSKLIQSLHEYLAGDNPGFGNAEPYVKEIDPFRDKGYSQRVVFSIEFLRDALANGKSREVALKGLMDAYGAQWGQLFSGDALQLLQEELGTGDTVKDKTSVALNSRNCLSCISNG